MSTPEGMLPEVTVNASRLLPVTGAAGGQQYLRNISLIVTDPSGQGLQLGSLRCVFEVRRGDTQTPNSCDVRVYNLTDKTANTINTEFTQLELKVSYGTAALQQIFAGQIKQVRKGREDQKNSYVAITAADADRAYNFSVSALTLAAGSNPMNAISALIKDMARIQGSSPTNDETGGQSISQGYMPTLTFNASIRGRTYYGMTRDELRELARQNQCTWSIQDGQVVFIPLSGYIPGPAVPITPYTGLIGIPEQTQNGLTMRVLLNPSIKIGQVVHLDYSSINQIRYGLDITSVGVLNTLLAQTSTKLNDRGLYYVMRAEHQGDTRGVPWYTDLTCLAVDAEVPLSAVQSAAIAPPFPGRSGAILQY